MTGLADVVPSYQAYFLRALEEAGDRPWTQTEFIQKGGQPLYEVYSRDALPPAGGPSSRDDRAEWSDASSADPARSAQAPWLPARLPDIKRRGARPFYHD